MANCTSRARDERAMLTTMQSGLYIGTIQHRRFGPQQNAFRYRIFMSYLDLAELPSVFDRYWLWSARRPAQPGFVARTTTVIRMILLGRSMQRFAISWSVIPASALWGPSGC